MESFYLHGPLYLWADRVRRSRSASVTDGARPLEKFSFQLVLRVRLTVRYFGLP